MTRREFISHVEGLCEQNGCTDKLAELHRKQAAKDWQPHPPKEFVNWWSLGGVRDTEKATSVAWLGIDATRAYNCQRARDTYLEVKQIGATT